MRNLKAKKPLRIFKRPKKVHKYMKQKKKSKTTKRPTNKRQKKTFRGTH